jgi:hypothetical protein
VSTYKAAQKGLVSPIATSREYERNRNVLHAQGLARRHVTLQKEKVAHAPGSRGPKSRTITMRS